MKTKPVFQRRLGFLKVVIFWRYVSNERVWWVSWEGLHSLGRILVSSENLEKQICDSPSAGFLDGRQIWEVRFNELVRWASYEGLHSLSGIFISRFQRRLDFLKAFIFGGVRYR